MSLPLCPSLPLWPRRRICPRRSCRGPDTAFCRIPVDAEKRKFFSQPSSFRTQIDFHSWLFFYHQSCLVSAQVGVGTLLRHVRLFGGCDFVSFLLQPVSSDLQHQTLQGENADRVKGLLIVPKATILDSLAT